MLSKCWKDREFGVMDYVFFRHGLLPLVVQLCSSILKKVEKDDESYQKHESEKSLSDCRMFSDNWHGFARGVQRRDYSLDVQRRFWTKPKWSHVLWRWLCTTVLFSQLWRIWHDELG